MQFLSLNSYTTHLSHHSQLSGCLTAYQLVVGQIVVIGDYRYEVVSVARLKFVYYIRKNRLSIYQGHNCLRGKPAVDKFIKGLGINNLALFMSRVFTTPTIGQGKASIVCYYNSFIVQ